MWACQKILYGRTQFYLSIAPAYYPYYPIKLLSQVSKKQACQIMVSQDFDFGGEKSKMTCNETMLLRVAGCLFPHLLTYIVNRKFIGAQEILMNIFKKELDLRSY